MALDRDSTERLEDLADRVGTQKQLLQDIYELLDGADSKLREEPERARHWYRIIANLEGALRQAKGRLASLEAEHAHEERRQARRRLRQVHPQAEDVFRENAEAARCAEPIDPLSAAALILQTPPEETGSLSPETLALAQQYLEDNEDKPHSGTRKRLAGRIERANQAPRRRRLVQRDEEPNKRFNERRRQALLRQALDKVQVDQVDLLTMEEADMILHCVDLLQRRLAQNDPAERLYALLVAAPETAEKLVADVKKRRARLYSRRAR